jgi:AcrR family transcriptional regulator
MGVLDAAVRCVARWGLTKTTLDDVAKEAGCSRATVYRAFPGGKEALFEAVGTRELDALFSAVAAAVEATDDLEDALVAAITTAATHLEGHGALQFLLAHEPGLVLPHLAFHRLDTLLGVIRGFGAPLLAPRFLADEGEAARTVEWVARIVLSYLCTPAAGMQLTDDGAVRRLVRSFVLPGLLQPTA